jgi:uncharacterized membrane protein YdcZ (DUF606 family)
MQLDLLPATAALLVGGLLAVQAAANLQLSAAVRSPVGAATLQLGVAAALLGTLAALAGTLAALALLDDVEPWHLLGGLGSALYITAGILLFPRLGALVSVGLFVAGQMLASVTLDAGGLLGVPRAGLPAAAAAGALAVLAGMAVIVRAQTRAPRPPAGPAGAGGSGRARWVLLGLAAGAALPVQGRSTPSSGPTWTRRWRWGWSASRWPRPAWRRSCWPAWAWAGCPGRGWGRWAGCPGGAGWAGWSAPPTWSPCSCCSPRSAPPPPSA